VCTSEHLSQASLDVDTLGVEDRLVRRHGLMYADPAGTGWLNELFRSVETLLYHQDWCRHVGSGQGAGKRRSKVIARQRAAWVVAIHPDLAGLDLEALMAHDVWHATGDAFKRAYDQEQRSRVRFAQLYDVLGPAVLVDPTWTTANCLHASASFTKLIINLDAAIAADHELAARRRECAQRARLVVTSLGLCLGGVGLQAYVERLFERLPEAACEVH
jgi:hypothetical protein